MGRLIKRLEQKNYNITIIFVYLDSPQLCIARIKERVKRAGMQYQIPTSPDVISEAVPTSGINIK